MKNLSLNYYQRIMLWQLVGNHPAPSLKEASTYLRIIEKLRLTDAEMLATQFVQEAGRFSWRLPEADYGTRVVELEHEEAKALVAAMEAPAPVRVSDAEWMLKTVETLNAEQPAQIAVAERISVAERANDAGIDENNRSRKARPPVR